MNYLPPRQKTEAVMTLNGSGLSRRTFISVLGIGTAGIAGCSTTEDGNESNSPEGRGDNRSSDVRDDTRPPTPGDASWEMFQSDIGNTGRTSSSTGPGTALQERWSFQTGAQTRLSRGDNTVYTVPRMGRLTALDISDGTVRWVTADKAYRQPPAVISNRIFVPWRGALRELDPEEGEVLWVSEPFDRPITSRISTRDRTLFWCKPRGVVQAFDSRRREVLWTHESGHPIVGYAQPNEEMLYFANDEGPGVLHALDPEDGSIRWTFTTNRPSPGIPSTPVATSEVVYVGNDGGWAHAVDAQTGEERWRARVGGSVHTQPTIVGDRIYFGLRGFPSGFLKAYDRHTGEEMWSVTFEGSDWDSAEIWCTPIMIGDTLIVGSDNGRLYGIDPVEGAIRWSVETNYKIRNLVRTVDGVCFSNFGARTGRVTADGTKEWDHRADSVPLRSPPLVSGGTVYVGGMDSMLYAVSEKDGQQLWTQQTEQPISSSGVVVDESLYFQATKIGSFDTDTGDIQWGFRPESAGATAPTYADSMLYLCETSQIVDRTVYAVRTTDGEIVWEQNTETRLTASPALAEGVLLAGSRGGYLYGFDAATGGIDWRYRAEGWIRAGPTAVGDMVYVGDHAGKIHALELPAGSHQWTYQVPGPIRASPAYSAETLYVPTPESLTALDVSSRSERWQVPIGSVAAPAVDDAYVYLGGLQGDLHVLDKETGREITTYDTGDGRIRSAPAAVNGSVYVGGADGRLYALDAGTED